MTTVDIHAATHIGSVRSGNEDRYGATGLVTSMTDGEVTSVTVDRRPALAVVADGLGGHPCGEVASAIVVDHLLAAAPADPRELISAIDEANLAVYGAMDPEAGSVGMGTTVAAVLVHEDGLAVANVGDSPVFELTVHRGLVQLSTDDTPGGSAGRPGVPSSIVSQTLGGAARVTGIRPHLSELDLHVPHRLLLCTDGLTNFVPRDSIATALQEHDPAAGVSVLIGLALAAGGADNVTCVLVETAP